MLPFVAGRTASTRGRKPRPPISDTPPTACPIRPRRKPDRQLSGPFGPSDLGVDRFTVPAVRDRRAARPNPNFDVRIVDDDGTGLPTGMVGEIVCRPGYPNAMSAGYLRQHSGFGLHIAPHPDGFHTGPPDREKKCLSQYIVTITWWCSGAGWAARLLHGTHALGD
ncbi:hypothetical protein MMRN_42530 [Mycobacterium marinum]|nr:hypothetical protein MMRN_42530 [Mycobacterium marinum]